MLQRTNAGSAESTSDCAQSATVANIATELPARVDSRHLARHSRMRFLSSTRTISSAGDEALIFRRSPARGEELPIGIARARSRGSHSSREEAWITLSVARLSFVCRLHL